MKYAFLTGFVLVGLTTLAQVPAINDSTESLNSNFHFQLTTISQQKFAIYAPYTGPNSLLPENELATTLTATIFWGTRLWKGGELYINPEIAGGSGISSAKGIAGFTNGEAFRVGDPTPTIYLARAFIRQTINFDGQSEYIEEDANQLGKVRNSRYLTFALGKFSVADFFDNNKFSHDPRAQFFNWSLMSLGGWDYPANVRGYTWGYIVEYGHDRIKLRASTTLVPKEANGNEMDTKISKANSSTFEIERAHVIGGRSGTLRALAFYTRANMGNYDLAVSNNPTSPDITQTRKYSRTKYGFGLNLEQELTDAAGIFVRASWNDGNNETWTFTEIDRSFGAGLVLNGMHWSRKNDIVGIATVINGISVPHRNYLAAGGTGFIIGDGELNYSQEFIFELFYEANLFNKGFWISPDYQFVLNPAYNKDRGPANLLGIRAHIEF